MGRSSIPWANFQSWGAYPPTKYERSSGDVCAICSTRFKPAASKVVPTLGPMLGNQRFDKGARKPRSVPPGTSMKQPGFLSLEATWLTNLLLPMPKEADNLSD